LGLRPGASPAEIKDAHHRLMRAAHPDAGGSDWLAARINQARDVLIG
jgi:curved DNA-binding protein CbpA